jgi:carboxyl-terminal processing protease
MAFLLPCFLMAASVLMPLPAHAKLLGAWSEPPVAADDGLSDADKQEIIEGITSILHTYAFVPNVDFSAWESYIAKESDAIKKATNSAQFAAAVQGALTKFGLSHTYLITPEAVVAQEHNSSVGIGILIAIDPEGLLITRVYPKTPAAKAGLIGGDLITEVEGKKPTFATAVRGPEGSDVTIKVRHASGKTEAITLTRVSYSIYEAPSYRSLDADTAYVRIPTFHIGYEQHEVEDLFSKAQGAKNLILDLRGNAGGEISNLMHLLGLLLPPKTVIGSFIGPVDLTRYKAEHSGPVDLAKVADDVPEERRERVGAGRVPYFKGHIAVLINKSSGSASEMAAAALRDLANATLVGSHSAAAVLVSVIRDLPNGFKLQYPIRDYITCGRERLEGRGVEPDLLVKDPRIPGVDPDEPLKRALAVIERLSKESSYEFQLAS